mmetsp:Transcript_5262/g.33058  ORF Transcript_5262/g.33058 Transcript_5262/m.33058 type:complete len:366 (-) Transcript_5262:2367-3464(-)
MQAPGILKVAFLNLVAATALLHKPKDCSEECSRIRICCSNPSNETKHKDHVCQQLYGANIADGLFRDPRKFLQKSKRTMNFGSAEVFADFRCHSRYQGYYHRLWNCAVPFTPLIANPLSANATWLLDKMTGEILRGLGLLPPGGRVIQLKESRMRSRNRAIHVKARCVYRPYHHSFSGHTTMPTCVKCFQNLIFAPGANQAKAGSSCRNRTIVYIKRKEGEGRSQPGYEELLTWLRKSFPLLPVVTFFGNESLIKTSRIFNMAKVVVGPHGAGLVNTIFSQEDTYVVEITREDKPGHVWRTNIHVPQAAGTTTRLYILKAKDLLQKLKLAGKKGGLAKGTMLPVDEATALHLVSSIANYTSSCWK